MGATYLGLALLSAAALAFEITLTRLFSVTQWYHFAFLAVSVALLGYGASGTALSLVPGWARLPTARRASLLSALFSVTSAGAYLCLNHLPFDSYRIAWEWVQVPYLVLYYLALTVPFFCAGLLTGLLLTAHPRHAARLYAANLVGSALGGLVPIAVLPLVGEGSVLAIASLGLLASLVFQLELRTRSSGRAALTFLLITCCLSLLFLAWELPTPFRLRLSPYKSLSQVLRFPDAQVLSQRWNAFSRVDRVASSAIRSAPGLSLSYPGALPREDGLFVDGDDLSPVLVLGRERGAEAQPAGPGEINPVPGPSPALEFTGYLPTALPYQMRPGGRALVLEPRGGLDLWVALSQGAASAVAVESNALVVQQAAEVYQDPRVELVLEEGRSYARRSRETFDVVHLSLADGYRPVTSGAYSLGERYDLTVEAFQDYLARLRPDGLLAIERWLQLPPSEELRAGATAVEALRRMGVEDPAAHLVVIRGWQLGLLLVKRAPFSAEELAQVRAFCQDLGLDPVAMPGLSVEESNQFNILEEPIYFRAFQQLLDDPEGLYAASAYDVRPATDDRPFFFHFFKWSQTRAILEQLGKTWQPWGGSGYFVLLALLAVAAASSMVLVLVPLGSARSRSDRRGPRNLKLRVLVYFGLLGLGFLFVEIPLMQRFILFLGQPIYAFTAVLAALLFSSGLGSLASPRLRYPRTLLILAVAVVLYPLGLPMLFRALLGAPLAARLLATVVSLAPLGFLMGMPFPGGLAWLRARAPGLVPWAWAINGCASVIASVLAATIALSVGFTWVLVGAAAAYGGAWLAVVRS